MTKFAQVLLKHAAVVLVAAAVAGCTAAPIGVGIDDPIEQQNRDTHATNRALDKALVRPASNGYGSVVPSPVRTGVSNFASNLNMPGQVLNNLLQFRIENAGHNTFRFLMNTMLGFGGLLDVATEAGLENRRTDFGETLHVWGAPEGAYLELPLIGPSTERHAAGRVVDILMNPLNFGVEGPLRSAGTGASVAARFGDRYRYSDLVDSVLYESEDSYAQARLLYLQNRRFKLSGGAQPDYIDPYEAVYGNE
ncbi:phospholipid-binding lipoprotein MlaA [Litoreibacter ascidiaceicola]|uniref:Phospholipid-binding lipoprotein MlaA n=1 Tax=Litoreibacter ascidiaceicola TaxID=1486859 RepID=A0A1M5AZ97_9RHOB|nr:VacJ family lipoprotein [Litoreibacter ascidiaceicola]SHF35523.1 phospholipid-binding lipoprotein MlaA [Litoreibacter ascidiaceicola]